MSMPLSLLHGWGVTPAVWAPLTDELTGLDVRTPALRAPGDALEAWSDSLAETLPPGGALLGWSLGAMLAMDIARRHPDRVARLILIAPTPRFVAGSDWPHGLDAATVQGFRDAFMRDPARTQQRFVALQTLGDRERHSVADVLQSSLDDAQRALAPLAHGLRILATEDLRRRLPPASQRCLLIHGEHDALMPVGAAQWLAEGWSACHLHRIPAAGHAPFLSQPAEIAGLIRGFLA